MKFQLRDRFALEKRQSEISSQEIGCLRKEIHESLEGKTKKKLERLTRDRSTKRLGFFLIFKAFRSLPEKSGIQVDEILEPGCLHTGLRDARQAINVAKEIDEDRNKSTQVEDHKQPPKSFHQTDSSFFFFRFLRTQNKK
jgi:hypothetical protein